MARLGDILVADGVIEREALEGFAVKASGRLGDYLKAHASLGGQALARALATQYGLSYVALDASPAERGLFSPRDLPQYLRHLYVPYRHEGGRLTIATPQPVEALRELLGEVNLVVISMRDFAAYLANAGAQAVTRRARLDLRRMHRGLVASRVMMPHQLRGFLLLAALLTGIWLLAPSSTWRTLLIFCNLFYFTTLAFKLQLYLQGMHAQRGSLRLQQSLDNDIAAMDERTLPVYTLLVPLYDESAAVMRRLIANLTALDYPKEKLDIKLICEADDEATIDALKALSPPQIMEILRVPPSRPRTKPKACNVALQQVRGEYLVIFDAEDAPEPKQLKRALALFRRSAGDVACLQSPLNYYNRNENMLTQLFAIEYGALFDLLLPALERMELPMPLGGTSNHLKVDVLRETGGWDAFNVTEDADLGIRLAYLGRKTRMLPSLTLEEAPITLGAWMKQRTRWIKGYIQTWLVYMRDAGELKRRLGTRGYYGFQFFIGAPALTFLFAPFFWGIFLLASLGLIPTHLSGGMVGLCLVSFMGGIASHWLFAREVVRRERWHEDMRLALLVFPFYWLLHSIACVRALWQLASAPHYWEKTTHGLSRVFR